MRQRCPKITTNLNTTMMKPKALPIKVKIDVAISTFLSQFKPGDRLRTEDVIKYVHKYCGRYIYGDTILRYLRLMREEGKINYHVTCRRSREMEIL